MKPTSNMGQNQKESEERSKKKSWWNKAVVVVIVILIMLIFFVSTRDYEKFKIVNKKTEKLEPWLELVVEATKECNKLSNEAYRNNCYFGISYAVGYNHFENRSEACPKLFNPRSCDRGIGKRAGEEFYNNTTLAFEICQKIGIEPNTGLCNYHAMRSAARMLAYHNKSLEYCETVDEQYRNECYEGMSWGLGQQYYPMDRERLISNCKSLGINRISCNYGIIFAGSEYLAKNPSYAEVNNKRMVEAVQQNRVSEKNLNFSAEAFGFYAGIEHFKDLEMAFTICDNLHKDLDESLKTICYENVYSGFGYAYYSELFDKTLNPAKKT